MATTSLSNNFNTTKNDENDDSDETNDDDDDDDDYQYENDASFCSRALANLRRHWNIVLLGQVLSLCLASAGAAQATLYVDCNLSAPTFTMATYYLILGAIHGPWLISDQNTQRRQQRQLAHETHQVLLVDRPRYNFFGLQLQRPTWLYVIMAILDVEANAITVLAFRYTTLTSVTLLDSVAIPSAMVVSKLFLGRKYTWVHLLGVVVCMWGVVMNVWHDSKTRTENSTMNDLYPHKLLGDILATIGGIMYGLTDTLIEATLRKNESTVEYLALVGSFAFLVSFLQAMILERDSIMMFFGDNPDSMATCSLFKGWALLSIFVGVTVCSYMGGSRFLMISEAAFFNLSLLTGDFWSLAFSVFYEKIVPGPLFFVALTFVLSGVVLYEMAPHPVVDDDKHDGRTIQQLAEIDSEFELQQGHEESIEFGDEDDEDNDIELL